MGEFWAWVFSMDAPIWRNLAGGAVIVTAFVAALCLTAWLVVHGLWIIALGGWVGGPMWTLIHSYGKRDKS